jgi:hypothetical protein
MNLLEGAPSKPYDAQKQPLRVDFSFSKIQNKDPDLCSKKTFQLRAAITAGLPDMLPRAGWVFDQK